MTREGNTLMIRGMQGEEVCQGRTCVSNEAVCEQRRSFLTFISESAVIRSRDSIEFCCLCRRQAMIYRDRRLASNDDVLRCP